MKKTICAILVVCLMLLCFVSCGNNYDEYAGTYYSSQGEKGVYNNCPKEFVFFDDGEGIYHWKGSTVYFEYKVSNDGSFEMTDTSGIFNYTGKFSDSKFVLDGGYSSGKSLEYNKE